MAETESINTSESGAETKEQVVEQSQLSNQDVTVPELTREDLAELENAYDVDDLLDLPEDIRSNEETYKSCCRKIYDRSFKSEELNTIEEVELEFSHFLTHLNRLGIIRTVIINELLGGNKPSKQQGRVLNSISLFISNELGIEIPNEDSIDVDSAARNIDCERVRQIIQALNIRFVDQLPDDQFTAIASDGAVLVNPNSTITKGYDELAIIHQILGATNTDLDQDTTEDGDNEDAIYDFGDEAVGWFADKGIGKEDLCAYNYFKHQEAYALASLIRNLKQNPQEGKVSPALAAEYQAMLRQRQAEPDKDFEIAKTFKIAYEKDLNTYRAQWQLIKKTGLDISIIPTDNTYNYDSDGPEGSEVSNSEASTSSGNLEKKAGKGVTKGERAGLKVEGPKNIKEALFNIFIQADAEFGMNFNPVAQLTGTAA